MRQIILKALQTNALTTEELIAYALKKELPTMDILVFRTKVKFMIGKLKREGKILRHKGRYWRIGKEATEWYYNLTGVQVDQMRRAENLPQKDPTQKQLADLYLKYHLNRVNLTPTSTKQI